MTKLLVAVLLIAGLLGAGTTMAVADNTTDHSSPSYDMKAQAMLDLETVQKKFVDLANAVPADKFKWRPTSDTRSFAEVLLHVAGERYQILGLMGANPPEHFNEKVFEKSTTDKAQIVSQLNQTWEFTKQILAFSSQNPNLLNHLLIFLIFTGFRDRVFVFGSAKIGENHIAPNFFKKISR